MYDAGGLLMLINPNGSKWWRFKYRFAGREKALSLGTYPDTGLKKARARLEEVRALVADGVDPAHVRKQVKRDLGYSVETVAREWFATKTQWAESHSKRVLSRLETWVYPALGSRPIRSITPTDVLDVLRRIEKRGTVETAHRVKSSFSQILRYAVATQRADRDVTVDLRGALQTPTTNHFAAIIDPVELGGLLRAIQQYRGTYPVQCALNLTPHLIVRPGELRRMEWAEIDVDQRIWTIPSTKMKGRRSHLVPLSDQSLAILDELRPLTGNGQYVFPSLGTKSRPMSENTVNAALRRLGYSKAEVTAHGFRASARTLMDEVLHERVEIIEHQLGHAVRDSMGRAYNRTSFLDERRAMMTRWSNYLDSLTAGADIVPLHTTKGGQ
jgi:integrase